MDFANILINMRLSLYKIHFYGLLILLNQTQKPREDDHHHHHGEQKSALHGMFVALNVVINWIIFRLFCVFHEHKNLQFFFHRSWAHSFNRFLSVWANEKICRMHHRWLRMGLHVFTLNWLADYICNDFVRMSWDLIPYGLMFAPRIIRS